LIEPITTVGIGAITVLQLANLWQSKRTANKVDSMVTRERCDERRKKTEKDIEQTNIRLMHHQHNGCGVKITKI